ncbi:MAG: leucine-rich repeat domain-containing protein [Clostridia bacterium]|nr:leucine-rich repeat domain-containing protein [Clostridia bacterium]
MKKWKKMLLTGILAVGLVVPGIVMIGCGHKVDNDATYTITYDYGKALKFFKVTQESQTIQSNEWLTDMPAIRSEYEDAFKGWFIAGSDKQIKNYDFVGGDVTLEARFNVDKVWISGLYQNGKYMMTWDEIKQAYPDAIVDGEIKNKPVNSYFSNLLGELVLDAEVTTIKDGAFQGCYRLTSITIPDEVTQIGRDVFSGCTMLSNITVEIGNGVYDSRDNCNAIIETSTNKLITGGKLTVIPNSVTSIESGAFDGRDLISITIPSSVISIGSRAFGRCDDLVSIIVDEGNTVYDSRNNCNAIIDTSTNTLIAGCKSTIIPNSVTSIGNSAFYGCTFTTITIPNSVTSIGLLAFQGCNRLTSITIPNKVNNIGTQAFNNCMGLISVIFPNSVTNMGYAVFSACSKLESLYYLGNINDWNNINVEHNGDHGLTDSKIYFYVENEANVPNDGGNYWHYADDGETPVIWEVVA